MKGRKEMSRIALWEGTEIAEPTRVVARRME